MSSDSSASFIAHYQSFCQFVQSLPGQSIDSSATIMVSFLSNSTIFQSTTLQICGIPDDLKTRLRQFRFSKSESMNVLILKVDREAQMMRVDEDITDCSLEDICAELPEQQPRFLLLSYSKTMSDGRKTFPMCLIFYSPTGL